MHWYFLLVEGQNLDAFILDTENLSTTRGGSLALLDVVHGLASELKKVGTDLEEITSGASSGLWRFAAPDDAAAADIEQKLRAILVGGGGDAREDPFRPARHATFEIAVKRCGVVAANGAKPDASDFVATREGLIAAIRRAQMAAATQVYPALDAPSGDRSVCEIDLVRPARVYGEDDDKLWINGREQAPVSDAVWDRYRYGLYRKQDFYPTQLALAKQETAVGPAAERVLQRLRQIAGVQTDDAIRAREPFSRQLNSISEPRLDRLNLRTNLADKIAVIYMDGNKFRAVQDAFIKARTADPVGAQKEFDILIRAHRRKLLVALLDLLLDDSDKTWPAAVGAPSEEEREVRKKQKHRLCEDIVVRFETLLWGGDEMVFVVPARFGWRAAETILEETAGWDIEVDAGQKPIKLHNAIGLVFCHHDAPIARIQALARKLAEHAKALNRSLGGDHNEEGWGRKDTLLVPMVLESFDHIGGDFDVALARKLPPGIDKDAGRNAYFALKREQVNGIRRAAESLAGRHGDLGFSRRQLRTIARAIHGGWDEDDRWSFSALQAKALNSVEAKIKDPGLQSAAAAVCDYFAQFSAGLGQRQAWIMLEELWDYLLPLRSAADAEDA